MLFDKLATLIAIKLFNDNTPHVHVGIYIFFCIFVFGFM